jgi:hypothetical protein
VNQPVPAHFRISDRDANSVFQRDDIDHIDLAFLEQKEPRRTSFVVASKKQRKRAKIATVCVKVTKPGATPDAAFPQFRGPPKQLKEKFTKWERKCQTIKTRLASKDIELEDLTEPEPSLDQIDHNRFDAEPETPKQARKRRRLAQMCARILTAKNENQAFPHFSENHPEVEEDRLHHKYARWHHKCSLIKKRLQAKSIKLDDLTKIGAIKRVKRDATNRRQKRQLGDDDFRGIRKELRMMSEDERQRYQAGMAKIKKDKIDGRSKYDLLTIYHTPQESPGAHWGPAFLPFHRELLKQLELVLRAEDPLISLPYWDTTLDQTLPSPKDSILWTKDFFGNNHGPVTEGPFANWEATHELAFVPGMRHLFRDVGQSPFGGLYKEEDLEFAYGKDKFGDLTACMDPTFELVHGVVHMFVGGYMADIGISPNDPSFYLHHTFIDFIWEEFRQTKQTMDQRENDYPDDTKACNNFHFGASQMKPFPILNRDGLSNNYTDDFYYYEPRPTCSETVADCASPYLYCDPRNYRCMSKVVSGGNCTGYEGTELCYSGSCVNGKCTTGSPPEKLTPATVTTQPVTTPKAPSAPPISSTTASTTGKTTRPITTPTTPPTTTPVPTTTTTKATTSQPTTTIQTTRTMPTTTTTTTAQQPTPTTTKTTTTTIIVPTTPRMQQTTSPAAAPRKTTVRRRPTRRPVTRPPVVPSVPPYRPSRLPVVPSAPPYRPSPPPTYGPATAATWQVCWFTVTVVRGSSYYRQPVPGGKVQTCGKNNPIGYTQVLQGKMGQGSVYPHYVGSALAQVRHPATAGKWPIVEATVEALDAQGRPCKPLCYQQHTRKYADCPGRVRISTNSYYSDPIVCKASQDEALKATWTQEGYYRKKAPDYLQFQCT